MPTPLRFATSPILSCFAGAPRSATCLDLASLMIVPPSFCEVGAEPPLRPHGNILNSVVDFRVKRLFWAASDAPSTTVRPLVALPSCIPNSDVEEPQMTQSVLLVVRPCDGALGAGEVDRARRRVLCLVAAEQEPLERERCP